MCDRDNSPSLSRVSSVWWCAVVGTGLVWRIACWGLGMPLWGDEAFLGLNVLQHSWRELAGPLDYNQVSPLLFLWAHRGVLLLLGTGELAVRLLPTLAGVSALLLFAALARRHLRPPAGAFATGFLAVAYYTVRHGSEFKPYAFDLLCAVVVLGIGLEWLHRKDQLRWPVTLTLLIPVLVGFSYPSVFVLGGVVGVLFAVGLWRREAGTTVAAVAAGCVLTALFVGVVLLGAKNQTTGALQTYWTDAFPPGNPLRLPGWLLDVHTGNLFAYPVGGKRGGSTGTVLLVVIGAVSLWRGDRRLWLALLGAPFLLTLLAAALHRYPYGGSARVSQHLAPAICILAGCGAAALIGRISARSPWRSRAAGLIMAIFTLMGVLGIARDFRRPYKTHADLQVRQIVESSFARHPRGTLIVYAHSRDVPANFLWYFKRQSDRVRFLEDLRLPLRPGDPFHTVFLFGKDPRPADQVAAELGLPELGYRLVDDDAWQLQIGPREQPPASCRRLIRKDAFD